MTAAEAAALLNLPTVTIRKMLDSGDIPGTWTAPSGEVCIPRDAILRFREQLSDEQLQGLERMAEDVAEMGLYDKPDADTPAA